MKFYSNNCDNGDYVACGAISELHLNNGDFTNARQIIETICNDMVVAPFTINTINNKTSTVSQDKARQFKELACAGLDNLKTLENFWLSCESGKATGCHNLGYAYTEKDSGLQQNLTTASQYYKKACDLGLANSCHNLGILYLEGQGVQLNENYAANYIHKACELGYKQSCDTFKKRIGEGVVFDDDFL